MYRRARIAFVLMVLATPATFGEQGRGTGADTVIALERGALDRWGRGDPSGYLELYSSDATYFDPMHEKRIDGLGALKALLEPIRGKVKVDRYEMIAPRVDRDGDLAVFTYNLVSHGRRPDGRAIETRWNVTAVYRREDGRWRIAHHHFSFTRPDLKEPRLELPSGDGRARSAGAQNPFHQVPPPLALRSRVFAVPVGSASHLASSTARVASPGPTAIVARTSRGEPPMLNSHRQKQKFWS
jgi:uncharacterized protein (TIGR02246 family)